MSKLNNATNRYLEVVTEINSMAKDKVNGNLMLNMSTEDFVLYKTMFKVIDVTNDLIVAYSEVLEDICKNEKAILSLLNKES